MVTEMAERVTIDNFDEKVKNFSGLALVEFYSDSCVPCKIMSHVLSALDTQFAEKLFVAKVNTAFDSELVEQYEVRGTPTFLLIKNGEVAERFTGARKKEELEQIIEANL